MFTSKLVALTECLTLRLDPQKTITFPKVESSSEPSSASKFVDSNSETLKEFAAIPEAMKDVVRILEDHYPSLMIPEEMVVLSDLFDKMSDPFLRSIHKAIILWFAKKYADVDVLPTRLADVDWMSSPFGGNTPSIYASFSGNSDSLLMQCLDYVEGARSSKSKKAVQSMEPSTSSEYTPIKPPLSDRASAEESPSSPYSTIKQDHGISSTTFSDFTVGNGVNLDGLTGTDRSRRSLEVVADDVPLDWHNIFSFSSHDNYRTVIQYLNTYYQIPRSFKINESRTPNFDDFSASVSQFVKEPSISNVNPILSKAMTLRSMGTDPYLLFHCLLESISHMNIKNRHALINAFLTELKKVNRTDLNNNGYVLVAFWLCVLYHSSFGEFDFGTPDELLLGNDESISAFWSRIVQQSHLFDTPTSSPKSDAKNYEIFISGDRKSVV